MSEAIQPALAAHLRALTPARVGLGRTGVSQQTRDLLDFQRAHAQARGSVRAQLEVSALAAAINEISGSKALRLHSAAPDRATYLQRPDLGRNLDAASLAMLESAAYDLVIIVADGLSALAVERHAIPLLRELLPRLACWRLAPFCIVEQGRVAIGDEIGWALGAELAVILIGERPGLSSPDSLGAYITWQPRPGRTDAERNCISNIRAAGLSYAEATAHLSYYMAEARRLQLSGIALKDVSNLLSEKSPKEKNP